MELPESGPRFKVKASAWMYCVCTPGTSMKAEDKLNNRSQGPPSALSHITILSGSTPTHAVAPNKPRLHSSVINGEALHSHCTVTPIDGAVAPACQLPSEHRCVRHAVNSVLKVSVVLFGLFHPTSIVAWFKYYKTKLC